MESIMFWPDVSFHVHLQSCRNMLPTNFDDIFTDKRHRVITVVGSYQLQEELEAKKESMVGAHSVTTWLGLLVPLR